MENVIDRILQWIVKHKLVTIAIFMGIFVLPLCIVHLIFKIPACNSYFVAEWNAGDLLGYIVGFFSFVGTVSLGLVTLIINKRLHNNNELLTWRPLVYVKEVKACKTEIIQTQFVLSPFEITLKKESVVDFSTANIISITVICENTSGEIPDRVEIIDEKFCGAYYNNGIRRGNSLAKKLVNPPAGKVAIGFDTYAKMSVLSRASIPISNMYGSVFSFVINIIFDGKENTDYDPRDIFEAFSSNNFGLIFEAKFTNKLGFVEKSVLEITNTNQYETISTQCNKTRSIYFKEKPNNNQ